MLRRPTSLSLCLALALALGALEPLRAQATPTTGVVPSAASPAPVQSTSPANAAQPASPSASPAQRPSATAPSTASTAKAPSLAPLPAAPPAVLQEPLGNDVMLDNADDGFIDEKTGVGTFTGNVRLRYRSYLLSCDSAVIDTPNHLATLSGHITLSTSDNTTHAEGTSPNTQLRLDLQSGGYRLLGGESAIVSPSALPASGLLLPLRLFGGEISGDASVIDARNATVTTCTFPEPHYVFGARDITIIPGKHLIARHVTLYRRGRAIATLSAIWLPLSNRYADQNLTPQVGYTPQEGYFAKFAEPYVLTAAALGVLRLDLMQYKGVGLGVDQSYSLHTTGNQGGTIKLYHLYDQLLHRDSWTGTWTHNQSLFDGFMLGVNSQFQQNSYTLSTGQSQTITSQVSLTRTTKDATTDILSNWQQSDFGEGLTSNLSSSWFQHEVLSQYSHIDFKFDFAQFDTLSNFTHSSSGSKSLTSSLDYVLSPKGYSFEVLVDKFTSLGTIGTGNFQSLAGVERLPEIKLTSDPATGAGNTLFAQLLPRLSKLTLDFGEFDEGISNMHTDRVEGGLDLGNHKDRRGDLTTTYTGSFQQYFYGDDTAQYIIAGQTGWAYAFQKLSTVSFQYSYLRPYGYTPFFFDRTGLYNNASANLNYNPSRQVQFSMGTGFDFTRDKSEFGLPAAPWQNLLTQLTIKPSKDFGTQLTATYDPNHGRLFDVTDVIQARSSTGFSLNTSARYIPEQQTFSEIDSSLDLPIIVDRREDAGYRIQAMEGYNGYTKTYSYQGLALTRSWHDWELSAIYQDITSGINPGRTIYFNLRLKAFPGYQPFGVGPLGQGMDTSIGQIL